ncbi:ribonuclease H-like domain-containing protein [Tanacetum coccineum]|uniref:Ribonuclease H-like domain-containing protein n=1 Tax=Tanacetum coccineum TaxID=301880 RepID=A0ABQ4WL77_9ASTR
MPKSSSNHLSIKTQAPSQDDLRVKDISIKDLKNQLEEALKEKDDLKLKLEKFENSSKNLTKLINSQTSAKDKTGLGYDSQINESELNIVHKNESEVIHSVFSSKESDVDDNPVNDRFKTGEGFHAVPPPYTRNYMPPRPDLSFAGLDESVFKSAVRKTTTSMPEIETSISKTSKDIIEKPKSVRPSASIIKEWDTNNDNDSVFRPKSDQTKPKFTKINFVKSGENVKSINKENTHRQKACFVCGSFNHLIKDYDFHDNKMVEKPVLNNKGRVTGQREIRPVWNNAQRVNHQTEWTHPHPKRNFVPTAVATKSVKKPINKRTVVTNINFNKKINTAKVNNVTTAGPKAVVSAAEGNRKNVVKSSTCWIWRPIGNVIDHISKDSGSYMLKRFDYGNLQYALQDQGIFDSGCSRHMMKRSYPQIIKKLMVDLLHLEEMLKEKESNSKPPVKTKDCRKLALSFMRPFGVSVTNINTLDHLGKFDGKSDDGFFVGYSINSKAFRVFNTRTKFVEENLHTNFLENKPNVSGTRPNWMFDIDTLTMSMNYQPVSTGNQTNGNAGTKANIDVGQAGKKTVPGPQYVLLSFLTSDSQGPKSSKYEVADDAGQKNEVLDPAKAGDKNGQEKDVRDQEEALRKQFEQEFERLSGQREATNTNSTNRLNTISSSINAVSSSFTTVDPGRERAQRNEFESVFGQDKDANGNNIYRMFTPVSAVGSFYDNLGGSIPVNDVALPNADLPTDPLMPDLVDTTDL